MEFANLIYAAMTEAQKSERFATAVACIDGRIQIPVLNLVRDHFEVDHVDMVTRPGVVANLSPGVLRDLAVSIERHQSRGIALVAHADCAGNPVADREQQEQCRAAAQRLRESWPTLTVLACWATPDGKVDILASDSGTRPVDPDR